MTKSHFAVVGYPARRSLSPVLFARLFSDVGIDADYVTHDVAPEELAQAVDELRRGAWSGLSVTAPHKVAVRALIDEEDESASRIGAVNTLVPREGRIIGYNTDAEGCARALSHAGVSLEGASVLLLGAGGAARAGVFAALNGGARELLIANRTRARADELAAIAADTRCAVTGYSSADVQGALAGADVLIQSTSVGAGETANSSLPDGVILPDRIAVFDMVYRPLETALLREARRRGCRTVDGLWMLVFQALRQFRLWTGHEAPAGAAEMLHAHLRGAAA